MVKNSPLMRISTILILAMLYFMLPNIFHDDNNENEILPHCLNSTQILRRAIRLNKLLRHFRNSLYALDS